MIGKLCGLLRRGIMKNSFLLRTVRILARKALYVLYAIKKLVEKFRKGYQALINILTDHVAVNISLLKRYSISYVTH